MNPRRVPVKSMDCLKKQPKIILKFNGSLCLYDQGISEAPIKGNLNYLFAL